jgi:hypothetical protein
MQLGMDVCVTKIKISIEIGCLCNYVANATNFIQANGWLLPLLLYKIYNTTYTYSYIGD